MPVRKAEAGPRPVWDTVATRVQTLLAESAKMDGGKQQLTATRLHALQDAAWDQIEAEADKLVSKSSAPMSREKAIDRVLKSPLDLARAYYGGGIDPLGFRVR